MLKKLLVASACMMAFATGGFAEKLTKTPVDLEIYGDLEAYYKMQNDYRTLLDSDDYFDSLDSTTDGNDFRDGANNRSKQNVRARGNLTMVARSGENQMGDTTWHNLIGVMKLKMDANDPDHEDGESLDGSMEDVVSLGDVWIRYSPAAMVGIKIGTQTVAATANTVGIGYYFPGDFDGDFVYWTAGVLDEKPGITIDFHLSKDIEFGIGILQGMGDFSSIVSGGSDEQAANTVAWFKGNFGFLEAMLGLQTVSVGNVEESDISDDQDKILGQWKQEYTHTLTNFVIKANIGDFSPFIAYQGASGSRMDDRESTGEGFKSWNDNSVDSLNTLLTALGETDQFEEIKNTTTENSINLTTLTVGLVAGIGPGKLGFEYTQISTPDYGEDGYVALAVEAASTMHLAYDYPITDNATLSIFYHALTTKESPNLRDDMDALENNVAVYSTHAAEFTAARLGSDEAVTALAEGITSQGQLEAGLQSYVMTSTASFGIGFKMTFGN